MIVVVIAALISLGLSYANRVAQSISGSYAVWWVADMVVEHLDANDGEWPKNWNALRDDYQTCVKRSGRPWEFEQLRTRVAVDWDANPKKLIQ